MPFDRVWNDGILHKIKGNGIEANIFKLTGSILNSKHHCQTTALNLRGFNYCFNTMSMKRIDLSFKLQPSLPQRSSPTICNVFARPHLG